MDKEKINRDQIICKNMKQRINYKKIPLDITRKMVIASIAGNKKNAIHCLVKVDITKPRESRNVIFKKQMKKYHSMHIFSDVLQRQLKVILR